MRVLLALLSLTLLLGAAQAAVRIDECKEGYCYQFTPQHWFDRGGCSGETAAEAFERCPLPKLSDHMQLRAPETYDHGWAVKQDALDKSSGITVTLRSTRAECYTTQGWTKRLSSIFPNNPYYCFKQAPKCPAGQFVGLVSFSCRTQCPAGQYLVKDSGSPGRCAPYPPGSDVRDDVDPDMGPTCYAVGNPINPANGNKYQVETDLPWAGGVIRRTYNSLAALAGQDDGIGLGWSLGALPRITRATRPVVGDSRPADLDPDWRWMSDANSALSPQYYRLTMPDGATVAFSSDGTLRDSSNKFQLRINVFAEHITVQTSDGVYTFNTQGRLLQHIAYGGPILEYSYHEGRLLGIRDVYGRTLMVDYAGEHPNRIAGFTREDGAKVRYQYDDQGRLTHVTRPDGTTRQYLYEKADQGDVKLSRLLTGILDEDSQRYASWSYYDDGRARTAEHAGGADRVMLSYQTDSQLGTGRHTDVLLPLGGTVRYTFKPLGHRLLLEQTSRTAAVGCPAGNGRFGYDARGNLLNHTDYKGNVTQYQYHAVRDLEISRTEGIGSLGVRTTKTAWHPEFPRPVSIETPGQTTTMEYDTRRNLLVRRITDTQTRETRSWQYGYSNTNQLVSQIDPAGRTTSWHYNHQGNLTEVTEPGGLKTQLDDYNAIGQPGRMVEPDGIVTRWQYDPMGRLLSKTVGSQTTGYQYHPTGLLKQVTAPDGSYISYRYDPAHRLIQITDSQGNRIDYTLDAAGNRTHEAISDNSGSLSANLARITRDLAPNTTRHGSQGD